MSGPRRGNTITTTGGVTLPGNANGPVRPRQETPTRSTNYTRMVSAMRECTHSSASVPVDTPRQGWN